MKQTKNMNEAEMRNKVYEMVKGKLDEFRGNNREFGYDGDYSYIAPGKEIPTNPHFSKKWRVAGKRDVNVDVGEHESSRSYTQYSDSDTVGNRGKAIFVENLLNDFIKICKEDLQFDILHDEPTGKIEWSDEEIKAINNIYESIEDLKILTKKEGNKKRGYNGPEESEEEL